MSDDVLVPTGFRFSPTDQELLMFFLKRMVLGQDLPWNGIFEKELYGNNANPWDLFNDWERIDLGENEKRKVFYAFTKLVKVGNGNKNINRIAGCGTWHGQSRSKDIVMQKSKTKIGSKRMFTFRPRKGAYARGHWIMHEYSLCDAGLKDIGSTDYVVCRITKHESKYFKKQESKISGLSAIDFQDCEKFGFVECSGENEITQVLGKRKFIDDNHIPQAKKAPRENLLVGMDQLMMLAENDIEIGVNKDPNDNCIFSNMPCEDFLANAPCQVDLIDHLILQDDLEPFLTDLGCLSHDDDDDDDIIDFSFLDDIVLSES